MHADGPSIASQPPEAALAALRSQAAGLAPDEVQRRLQAFGPNRVETLPGEPVWLTLLREFTHFFALVLWLAAGLAFAAEPRGRLHVDDGASIALRRGKASLLAAGITRVEGTFAEGEPVEIVGAGGEPLGRGFVGYSSAELAAEAGHSSAEEGHEEQRPAVHRDQMMLAD